VIRAAVVLVLVACSHSDDPIARVPPPLAAVIPASTTQLVVAVVPDWNATTAELRLWQRDDAGWRGVGDAWPGVIGAHGAGWGAGLHGVGAPAGRRGPVKREGDGKSPAGVFAIGNAFGYAAAPPTGAQLRYTAVDDDWKCVDDATSVHYATVLDRKTVSVDWSSAEDMHRKDALYTWVIDVAHNPAHKPGGGSCIFLHVWRGPEGVTSGCTAMAEPAMARLVAALDPARAPLFVLLPRAEYDALAPAWGLPAR
jgi:D-alanyl-D-alanine dipeptidase